MQCRYCFYSDLSSQRTVRDCGKMTLETAEQLIKAAFQALSPRGAVSFSFQGGEPTLAGLDFYRSFLALEQKYARPHQTITHAIQTNGLALNEEWAQFLKENHFLVGLSIDGRRDIHDALRPDMGGAGTWDRCTAALSLLQKHGVEVNLLCVVSAQCARSPSTVYQTLKKLKVPYLQFIPCLDPYGETRGLAPHSLRTLTYGKFLCHLFDLWYKDWKNGQYVSIRLFDDYVHRMMGLPAGTCSTTGQCGSYLVCEADGSLYPCDFYVLDQWRLGHVGETPLEQVVACSTATQFYTQAQNKPIQCASCRWQLLCQGGCPRDWVQTGAGPVNWYCADFRRFFSYTEQRLAEIAQAELRY